MIIPYDEIEAAVRESVSEPDSEKDFIKEVLGRLDEDEQEDGNKPDETPPEETPPEDKPEDDPSEESPFGEDDPEETPPEKDPGEETPSEKNPEKPSDEKLDPPKPEFSSLEDMMSKTGTEITVQKQGTEPSPIFGPNDTKPHDKWKVTLRNENGSIDFIFWSSLAETRDGIAPDRNEMIASIAQDCAEYGNSMSLDEFRTRFGYEDSDVEIAQKSYDGFRKLVEDAMRMFPEGEYDELVRLGNQP